MNKNIYIAVLAILIIGGGAYWVWATQAVAPDNSVETSYMPVISGENPQPGSSVHDLPVEPAAAAARSDLAATLGVNEKSIVIMQITENTWNDGCLGLDGPAESCLRALVPGFQVEMLAQGKTYIYRTDATGSVVRPENN